MSVSPHVRGTANLTILQLEKLLQKNYFLHQSARDGYRSYLQAYASYSLKSIFDINALDLNKVGKAFGFAVPPRVNVTVGGGKSGAGKSGKRKRDNNDDEDGEDNFDEDEAVRDSDNGDDHEVSEKPTGGRRQGKSRRLETMGKKKVGKEFYKKSKEKHSKKGSVQWSR